MVCATSWTGTELGDQSTWNGDKPTEGCYTALLNLMGDEMLMGSSKEGKGPGSLRSGSDHFKKPQTFDAMHNSNDTHCHMPSKHGFPAGPPFARIVTHTRLQRGHQEGYACWACNSVCHSRGAACQEGLNYDAAVPVLLFRTSCPVLLVFVSS